MDSAKGKEIAKCIMFRSRADVHCHRTSSVRETYECLLQSVVDHGWFRTRPRGGAPGVASSNSTRELDESQRTDQSQSVTVAATQILSRKNVYESRLHCASLEKLHC